jgi:hypothetical protein
MTNESLPIVALWTSIVALVFTVINVIVSISNFVLTRVRLLQIRKISSGAEGNAGGNYLTLELDVLSWGAAIFDLKAELVVFVRKPEQSNDELIAGTTRIQLRTVDPLPNPLLAGNGVRFKLMRSSSAVQPGTFDVYLHAAKAMKVANLRDVCIEIRCSGDRKILKRLRCHSTVRKIDEFLGKPRGVRWGLWEKIAARWRNRKIIREAKKHEASIPSMTTRITRR